MYKMVASEIEYIKSNLKWSFSWSDSATYLILVGPVGMAMGACSMFYGGFKFGNIYENNFINSFFFTAFVGLVLSLFISYYVIMRIEIEKRFTKIVLPKNVSFNDIQKKIKSSNWILSKVNSEFIEVLTNTSFFSSSEVITIVKKDYDIILFNCRPMGRQPFTFGRDVINLDKLKLLLNS
jgi:hypothetical protein